jgi:hypothetical protein
MMAAGVWFVSGINIYCIAMALGLWITYSYLMDKEGDVVARKGV